MNHAAIPNAFPHSPDIDDFASGPQDSSTECSAPLNRTQSISERNAGLQADIPAGGIKPQGDFAAGSAGRQPECK
jgi:hypothetical protein